VRRGNDAALMAGAMKIHVGAVEHAFVHHRKANNPA
jgi:hypothetical protein